MIGGARRTKKRAEAASLLALYREVLIILDRIEHEGVTAVARLNEFMRLPPSEQDPAEFPAISALTARLSVDIKSLYHWSYAIEDFFAHSSARATIDLAELRRIAIFRHKLMVHQARTPMRKRGHVPSSASTMGPDPENVRLVSHPILGGPAVWRGHVRQMAGLNRSVPGLKDEHNLWEKIDLIYRHYNLLPLKDQLWVRNELFGAVGLRSDPPAVVAFALLVALQDYQRQRML